MSKATDQIAAARKRTKSSDKTSQRQLKVQLSALTPAELLQFRGVISPDDQIFRSELRTVLNSVLAQANLAEKQMEVIRRYYIQGETDDKIAVDYGDRPKDITAMREGALQILQSPSFRTALQPFR